MQDDTMRTDAASLSPVDQPETVSMTIVSMTEDRSRETLMLVKTQRCCECCRAEMRLCNFGFAHSQKDLFYSSQWRWPPVVFIVYRVVVAGYILAWLVYTGVTLPSTPFPWPAWLTNWSFLLLACHLVLACVISVVNMHPGQAWCRRPVHYRQTARLTPSSTSGLTESSSDGAASSDYTVNLENLGDALPCYIKLDWFMFAIISNMAFIVTIVYFVALFPMLLRYQKLPPLVDDMHLHLVNSMVILLEMAVTAIPVRLLHGLYPLLYGLSYIVFSAIYWAVDHDNVLYPYVLDWNHPGSSVLVLFLLSCVAVPTLQLMLFGLYKLRLLIFRRVYART